MRPGVAIQTGERCRKLNPRAGFAGPDGPLRLSAGKERDRAMRFVELCFHERDARAAELAVRGLTDAGVCVLRRPITDDRAPAPSPATRERVVLHSDALGALSPDHPAFAPDHMAVTVAVPIGPHWPHRASRPWLIVPPRAAHLQGAGFWKVVAWAAAQPIPTRDKRIATQQAVFRALKGVASIDLAPRRKRRLRDVIDLTPLMPVRGYRDWETAVTPLAVAGTLVAMAIFSALAMDAATRPEAWGAIAQDRAPVEAPGNAFNE